MKMQLFILTYDLEEIFFTFNACDQGASSVACRLYTGIHAKPKPKFKSGAISESTTALNVDQINPSVLTTDVKNAPLGAALPLQPSSAPSAMAVRGNSQEQTAGITITSETAVNESTAAATMVSAIPAPQKKETGLAKAPADKKKLDARKKSLKRL